MMREYVGVEMPPVEEFWTRWDAQLQYGTESKHRWMWSGGVDLGLFRYGHMIKGARRGLEQLAHEHEVGIVTHRPARATPDTVDWLSLYMKDIPYTLNILSNGEPKHTVKADVLIDDKGSNIEQWCRVGRVGILFERPWSEFSYVPGSHVARDWKEVVEVVKLQSLRTG
jgi:5'(3')-deoxyribonucleotidase